MITSDEITLDSDFVKINMKVDNFSPAIDLSSKLENNLIIEKDIKTNNINKPLDLKSLIPETKKDVELISNKSSKSQLEKNISSVESIDAELDELLDDALGDFDKFKKKVQTEHLPTVKTHINNNKSENLNSKVKHKDSVKSAEIEMNKIYETFFKEFSQISSPEDLAKLFNPNVDKDKNTTTNNLGLNLQKTLESLTENMKQLQENGLSEAEIMTMLSQMGMEGDINNFNPQDAVNIAEIKKLAEIGELNNFPNLKDIKNFGDVKDIKISNFEIEEADNLFPLMQNLMTNLLSKEVLYPSLKEVTLKYSKWLIENESNLSEFDHNRYNGQVVLMKKIVEVYEEKGSVPSCLTKGSKPQKEDGDMIETVLELMQKLQELGQPPKEIIGDMPMGMDMGNIFNPDLSNQLPLGQNQCFIC